MRTTARTPWSRLRVGLLLMITLVVLVWVALTGDGISIFEASNPFTCYFRDVDGLLTGSPVWMAGVEVGSVKDVKFVNLDSLRKVQVVGSIKRDLWYMITNGTKVQMGTIGLLGDKFVDVIPGPVGASVLPPGDTLPTEFGGGMSAMMDEGSAALQDVGSLAGNLDEIVQRVNRGEGTLGQLAVNDTLYLQMTRLVTQLTALAADLSRNQERISSSVEQTADAVASMSEKVDNNTGTLGRLVNDPKLYENLTATSAKLDSVMARINTQEGSLGLLVSDTALYIETVNLLHRVNNLVTDIEKNPRKYFKFSVF